MKFRYEIHNDFFLFLLVCFLLSLKNPKLCRLITLYKTDFEFLTLVVIHGINYEVVNINCLVTSNQIIKKYKHACVCVCVCVCLHESQNELFSRKWNLNLVLLTLSFHHFASLQSIFFGMTILNIFRWLVLPFLTLWNHLTVNCIGLWIKKLLKKHCLWSFMKHVCIHIYMYSHPQTDLFRSIRTHQCGQTVSSRS